MGTQSFGGNAARQRQQRRSIESPCETNRSTAKSRSMPSRALRIRSGWFGDTTLLVLVAAIVLMLGLSVAPNLHARLHPPPASLHDCPVSLIPSAREHPTASGCLALRPDRA